MAQRYKANEVDVVPSIAGATSVKMWNIWNVSNCIKCLEEKKNCILVTLLVFARSG